MPEEKTYTASEVVKMMERQPFADFHSDDGMFGRYIMGPASESPTRENVVKELDRLLEMYGRQR